MKLQLIIVETGDRWRRALLRMVLDPKSISHNDYGSFHTTEELGSSHHTTINVPVGPDQDDDDPPETEHLVPVIMTRDQRQPLLPLSTADGVWMNGSKSHSPTIEYFDDVTQALEHRKSTEKFSNDVVLIDVPIPQREKPRFPKEKGKTFIAFLCLFFTFILTTLSLALTHDRVPDRRLNKPLPDIFLDNVASQDWALDVSEILIMVSGNSVVLMLIFHKHKYIVMRRIFMIIALLYLMRSITMFVTVLPMSNTSYYCSPKSNATDTLVVVKRVLQLMSGMGLSINGQHTFCGDFIYSGHTVILVMCYLIVAEYSPKRLYLVQWLQFAVSVVGVVMVMVAHGHYTIDVIVAYYVTTTLFWTYHTLAHNASLKQSGPSNYLARHWWFPLFAYFESNVDGSVPRQYEWPLPWPRRCLKKHPNRNS